MKTLVVMLSLIAAQWALGQAPGASARPEQRIVTRTRLVTQFTDLEADVADAIRMNDQAALDRLLSRDFEVWTPEPPGHPIPRDEWLKRFQDGHPKKAGYGQFAAKDLGGPVIVNFVLTQSSAGKPTESFFVVDVWKKDDNQWQLSDRYLAPVHATAPPQHPSPTGKQ